MTLERRVLLLLLYLLLFMLLLVLLKWIKHQNVEGYMRSGRGIHIVG